MILRPTPATGPRNPSRHKAVSLAEAEKLAVSALQFLTDDDERIGRFLALSGLDISTLRKAVAEPGFLPAVLDHLAGDERLVLAFAEHAAVPPERILQARHLLAPEADFG